jgi:4-alpha-glucanotransferase
MTRGAGGARTAKKALAKLARLAGVQALYTDSKGRRRTASPERLVQVLRALGEEIDRPEAAPAALRAAEARARAEALPPCLVVWDSKARAVPLKVKGRLEARLILETGGEMPLVSGRGGGLRIPAGLPSGYHRLEVSARGAVSTAAVISAPKALPGSEQRQLALFAPTYALRDEGEVGVGDLTSLGRLAGWAREQGVHALGTLPLLAGFLDEPFDPSPYSPVSRLFWNELFIDPRRTPEIGFAHAAETLDSLERDEGGSWVQRLRAERLVDYRAVVRLKRRTLERLADAAHRSARRRAEIERWLEETPHAARYALFRAAAEAQRAGWHAWPERLGSGDIRPGDYDERVRWYHVWCQATAAARLERLARGAERGRAAALYLDLPVGVHADGFDTWRFRNQFVDGWSVGAPPDALFEGGQSWSFPPPHPRATRGDGHRYFAACVREHLRYAGILRIDHAAALARLFWVPPGAGADEGVYVASPAEELHAVLNLEASRAGARIVAENLGTVPESVNRGLKKHGVLGMHVAQFAVSAESDPPAAPAPAGTLACVNTHDTPTFEAFRTGADIDRRITLGLVKPEDASGEREARAGIADALRGFAERRGVEGPHAELRAMLEAMAEGEADLLLVTLEDLWGETEPQNIPGVTDAYPAWRRKLALTLGEIEDDQEIAGLLRSLAALRMRGGAERAESPGAPHSRVPRGTGAVGRSREAADERPQARWAGDAEPPADAPTEHAARGHAREGSP